MKVDFSEPPEGLGNIIAAYKIPSRSEPGRYHVVLIPEFTEPLCTCRGWQYQHKCRHMLKVRDYLLELKKGC